MNWEKSLPQIKPGLWEAHKYCTGTRYLRSLLQPYNSASLKADPRYRS